MFFQQTKENQIKFLKEYLLIERLSFFTKNYLEKQNYRLMLETIKNASDFRKIKNLTNGLVEQNVQLEGTEVAMLNLLEDSQELEERMSAIISSMGEGLTVVDTNYRVILINDTAARLLEISKEKAINQNIGEIIPLFKEGKLIPFDDMPVTKVLKTGATIAISLEDDVYCHLPSGKKFPIILVDAPLKGNGVTGTVVIFKNASEEKALDEARTNFISIASHQLRTPLTAIRWYTEMLKGGDAGELNDDQKSFLNQIYDGVLRLGDTLSVLLSLARAEGGQTKIISTKFNFFKFVEDIAKELDPLIKQKNIKLIIDIGNKKPEIFEISIDQSLLNQVITNLLSNSIRYTNKGGNINIKIDKAENELICSVKDDGIGIPENQKGKIFEKFFRAENAKNAIPDGNGLGLTLVKNLVELWKGKIWFESPADWNGEKKGTIFYFTIPL